MRTFGVRGRSLMGQGWGHPGDGTKQVLVASVYRRVVGSFIISSTHAIIEGGQGVHLIFVIILGLLEDSPYIHNI